MKKFEGMLICTDLDGTLFRNDKTISEENIKAIEYFKQEGGIFTFVTGRMPFFVFDVYEAVKPNGPIGCVNGAGLYDFVKGEYLWKQAVPDGVMELVEVIDKKFPEAGIQVNTFDKVYFSKENETMEHFREVTKLPNLVRAYRDVDEAVAKIVFGSETEEDIIRMEEALRAHPLADRFDFISSEKSLFEILTNGINKGTSISKLCEYMNIDINKTVAVGDYNNDIPMLQAAKVGVAVSNACEGALKAADYVTVSNEENAIYSVICDIENGKFCELY